MKKLIQGVHQFQQNIFGAQKEFFEDLVHGQRPETLFITCSDSRVNPNLITQTEPGEIFILRNAGNIIPSYGAGVNGEAATIEYAVGILDVKYIVVCGHSHCGAMSALIQQQNLNNYPTVQSWLKHAEATRRIVLDNYEDLGYEDKTNVAIQENVLVQIENLRTHPSVASRLARGDLHVFGWVYQIGTGEVYSFDPKHEQFLPLGSSISPHKPPRFNNLPFCSL